MKLTILALTVASATQVLPAALQIYAPATEVAATISVATEGDLQAAIDNARPGDVIALPAGAVYTGNFVLPEKSGDRYITIRTANSQGLPGAGERISPQHAGTLARLLSPNAAPVIRTAPGAHHWRLLHLEIGPTANGVGDLVVFGDATSAQAGDRAPRNLVIDRCYIHGHPQLGQKRGVAINSASTTIINSHISDIKARGIDTQAIAGWSGPGPFHIENNYLEASGENFMLGGGVPAVGGLVPSDVVFRRNHVARPLAWRTERWTVKNLFELKNARRVLVEGNLFENNWPSGQAGYAIVLTPRGERGRAPWSTVEDVTFRYNIIRNVAAGFNLLGRDDAGPSGTMRRIRIADNLLHDFDRELGGNGAFLLIGDGPAEIVIEHNTALHRGNIITAYGGSKEAPEAVDRFVFRNNLTQHNTYGIFGDGLSGPAETFAKYFPGAMYTHNVLAGGRATGHPGENMFPDMERFRSQFVDYAGGDYRLRRDSEYRRAATDGSDLGVNFVPLVRAIGARAREWLGLARLTSETP